MSSPYWSIKHVESMADLPDSLTRGRAYFVDDEQIIVIDHGRGPVIYGGKAGPQGIAGDPLPQLQDQIDDLAAAELTMQALLYELHEKYKSTDESLRKNVQDLNSHYSLEIANVNQIAEMNLQQLQSDLTERFDFLTELSSQNAAAILAVTLMLKDQFTKYDNMFATLTKSIMNLYPLNSEGTTELEVLSAGDSISAGGSTWTVSSYETDESGMISFSLTQ